MELYDRRQTKFISAHNNALSCLVLSMDGKRLVTASEKGTLVRVWNTADGQPLQELRRGADPAHIYSLALSRNCDWLALSSDKGTVHVFALCPAVALTTTATAAAAAASGKTGGGGGIASSPATAEEIKRGLVTTEGSPAATLTNDGEASTTTVTPPRQNPTSFLSIVKVSRVALGSRGAFVHVNGGEPCYGGGWLRISELSSLGTYGVK